MPKITDILIPCPILHSVIKHLTALDLFHLATASRSTAEVLGLKHSTFDNLKRYTSCDGSGTLAKRTYSQSLKNPYYELLGDQVIEKLGISLQMEMSNTMCDRTFRYDPSDNCWKNTCLQELAQHYSRYRFRVCEESRYASSLNIFQ